MSDERKRRLLAIVGIACYPLSEAPVWRLTEDSGWWQAIESGLRAGRLAL
jgi:hypothetical protein